MLKEEGGSVTALLMIFTHTLVAVLAFLLGFTLRKLDDMGGL